MKEIVSGRVFVHATNVHQGGGHSLLMALLKVLDDKVEYVLSLDERMSIPIGSALNVQIKHVKPSLMTRLRAERDLAQSVAPGDIVLCFGNLPPLYKLRGHVVVFVQNRYLIDDVKLSGFPLWVRIRLAVERVWLSVKMLNVNEFIVQTPTMKRFLMNKTRGLVPIRVLPFVEDPKGYRSSLPKTSVKSEKKYDFVYVASGEPHKNHRRLIEAWCLLAGDSRFPSLCLTLDEGRFAGLCREIDVLRQRHGLKIVNAGGLLHEDVMALYKNASALIYPSTFESFGLPLIEAMQASLPIVASELDYVRDVLNPVQTFDPMSAVSIAKAVSRYMGIDELPLPLMDAKDFMTSALSKTNSLGGLSGATFHNGKEI